MIGIISIDTLLKNIFRYMHKTIFYNMFDIRDEAVWLG